LQNVKEHATLSARASVDHGIEVKTTGEHVNRTDDRGCVSRLVLLLVLGSLKTLYSEEERKQFPHDWDPIALAVCHFHPAETRWFGRRPIVST
jgi:hypothetical protein